MGDSQFQSVLDFCIGCKLKNEINPSDTSMIQPKDVDDVCRTLSKNGIFSEHPQPTIDGEANRYSCALKDSNSFRDNWNCIKDYYNTVVYGFTYLYHAMKSNVLPIAFERKDGNKTIGTCFQIMNGIATCRHCVEGAIVDIRNKGQIYIFI